MKQFLLALISGFLLFSLMPSETIAQDIQKKVKSADSHIRPGKKIDKEEVLYRINKNTKSIVKNPRGSWSLDENFESGNFPPSGWDVTSGSSEWLQGNVSGYGIGNYCMYYPNYNCQYSNNTIYSPTFSTTGSGDILMFDFAYAPYGDNINAYYDNMEIYYYDENSFSWYSLIYYSGTELQTAPATYNPFVPQGNQWGTKILNLPPGVSRIFFQSWEDCDNNLFIDNIKAGAVTYALNEDFESGIFPPAGWNNPGNGVLWNQQFYSPNGNGNYCAYYDFFSCGKLNDSLVSPSFGATGSDDYLFFDYAYAPYTTDGRFFYDFLDIYTSTDGGDTYSKFLHIYCKDLQTAPGIDYAYYPQNSEWGTYAVIVPSNVNRIKFVSVNDCANNLFVDNIRVTGSAAPVVDAEVQRAWAKGKLPLIYGVPDTIMASVKNSGNQAINNLKVYLSVTGAYNLTDSATIPFISPGNSEAVSFKGIVPVINGFSNVTVTIPNDDNNGNNVKTAFSESNPSVYSYVDSNCCNSGVGFGGEAAFLNRYRVNTTGQVRKVSAKIYNDPANVGQLVYGAVYDQNGMMVGRSENYYIKSSDLGNYKTFDITDPKPFVTTNSYVYIGLAQAQAIGANNYFIPMQMDQIAPARPNANYSANLVPVGTTANNLGEFPTQYGYNWALQTTIGAQVAIDAGVSSLGLTYDQYFTSATYSPTGKVFNAGSGSATFTVNRKITPGAYTSTKSVTGLASGSTANVTFDPWTFTSGTTYTIRDSVVLASDGNISNNTMSGSITPRVAKQLAVSWQNQSDRDSLVRAVLSDGRYAADYDVVPMNYTGSYRPWKIIFNAYRDGSNWPSAVRDSLKAFLDNSTAGNKKSLVVFGNRIDYVNDPNINPFGTDPADTVFYRQYLRASTIGLNWPGFIPQSEHKFRGIGFFNGITQDSISDPGTPGLIKPTNGSSAAFKPMSVTGNNNDSCNAVSFAGANYNTFFMTNEFSSLRASSSSPSSIMGPVLIYTKIIDWIQSINTGAKVLDLKAEIQGFYDPSTNSMAQDTMRVYLRSSINPYPKVDSAKAYLNTAGQASFVFNNASNGTQYYIQLKHRNGLETWSKTTLSFSSNQLTYDFTTNANKAFGNNMILQGSNWVIYTGDVDQNGIIDLTDLVLVFNDASAFVSGYVRTDVNGDNITDLTDLVLTFNNSGNFVQAITPLSSPDIFVKYGITLERNQQHTETKVVTEFPLENKIDNDVYEKFKDGNSGRKSIPDLIYESGNVRNILKSIEIQKR